MEDKLLAYRRQQQRQEFFENIRIRLRNMISPPRKQPEDVKLEIAEESSLNSVQDSEDSLIVSDEEEVEPVEQEVAPDIDKTWRYCLFALYFVFWATCFAIAVELQFGAVFLVLSALFGIYFNTRTGPKPKTETMSAYSVFNKNVESIDGTLKAEQFEREIRYGSMSVR